MKAIVFLVTLTTAALAAVVYFGSDERAQPEPGSVATAGAPASSSAKAAGATADTDRSAPAQRKSAEESLSALAEEGTQVPPGEQVREMLEQSEELRGNMQAFFEALRELCADEGLDHAQCSELLEEALADHPDPAYAAMLERIMERLPDYEAAMQRTVMSMETPPEQRYAVLDAQRRQLLGEAEAELMYGQEKALAQYRFAYGDLMEGGAASLTPEQRLQQLEQLQREHFGEYEQALQQARGPHAAYEQERELLLVGVDDPQQRETITRQLREKHFDDETVAKMEARDEQVARQQATLEAYRADVAELDAEMAPLNESLTDDQWQAQYQQALRDLRLKHFSN